MLKPYSKSIMAISCLIVGVLCISAIVIHSQSAPSCPPCPACSAPQQETDQDMQAVTIKNMKMLVIALGQYQTDSNYFPLANNVKDLEKLLEPDYMAKGTTWKYGMDGWGRTLRYETWSDTPNPNGAQHYVLASAGRDGKWEQVNIRQYVSHVTASLDDDLVISDGNFLRHPSAMEVKH
jgi:hypothetical protein